MTSPSLEDPATDLSSWIDLLQETPEQYRQRVSRSALKRVKPSQFSRNLAIALSNEITTHRNLVPILAPLIHQRMLQEQDPAAQKEWERCVSIAATSGNRQSPNLIP